MSAEKRFCSECGKECTTNDKFCSGCGKALPTDINPTETSQNKSVPNPEANIHTKKNNKLAGFILIFLGALVFISDILVRIGIISGSASLSALVSGIGFVAFGIALILKRIKNFGWGIAAIATASGSINNFFDYYKLAYLPSLIACIVFVCLTLVFVWLVLKPNLKK